ncbi:MAG: tail fiber domain-containing protein [Ignavibacteria bacterium]
MQFSQHITNTLGTNGVFKIKDNSTEYFTLSQSTGLVTITKTLELGNTQNSTSSIGVITKGGISFIHNYFTPNTNGNNTFVGLFSGNFTMAGAVYNTAMGVSTMNSLTTGNYNSGFGVNSLRFNTAGSQNSAFGVQSLGSNTTGSTNSAFGYNSLSDNINGANNSAFGYFSLTNNTSGSYNTAFGHTALQNNISGNSNSSFGYFSLNNSIGTGNSGFGNSSLSGATGNNNTALGFLAGDGLTTGSNNIIVGYNADVPSGTANNQVRIGNTSITYAGIQVAWTITSDRRWKSNIQNSNLGLDFIRNLRPVSYTRINDETQKTEYGFIAQETEETLCKSGAENPGMVTIDDKGNYELRYNDLLAPMVKAIQELKNENDKLKEENLKLADEISRLSSVEERLAMLERKVMKEDILKEVKSAEK